MENIVKLDNLSEAQALFGLHDENIRAIEREFKVRLRLDENHLRIKGLTNNVKKASVLINSIINTIRLRGNESLTKSDIYSLIKEARQNKAAGIIAFPKNKPSSAVRALSARPIEPKTKGQREYVEAIKKHDIVFGIGPAGTGKTYLAMSCAVEALKNQEVRRIILTRPAIEAGESLGFLPGDIYEKISPYLRPLYDALYDMMDAERIEKYIETGIIEVAPLAYMRGRTLNDAFIILDEAQNSTPEQMKMFLTRLGFDSKVVITGDITQSDLPGGRPIGLLQAQQILKDIEGIKIVKFSGSDVVRHELVQKIIEAYEKASSNN
ncbi:MAG: PhoH family protein [Candidatus Omnitrophota bacterium]|nr:PhoH family protein [Candidatus Omnitrophota bacterium]MBU1929087.1 PhoH family protein [Candidatus Omnitrophota bacterium]MBU1929162.1 PhoH family protein [Candidatus Omnitrophota bacterium]MBU2035042.1 PhoH family protein [Candidatus Omnitrophota bacterium]